MYLISNEKQIILNVYSWVVLIMFARHSNFTQWYVQLYFSLCWTLTLRYRCKDVTNLLTRIHQFLNCWIYPVWYQHEHLKEICRNEFKILHSLGSSNNWVYKDISLSQCPSFLCHLRICQKVFIKKSWTSPTLNCFLVSDLLMLFESHKMFQENHS